MMHHYNIICSVGLAMAARPQTRPGLYLCRGAPNPDRTEKYEYWIMNITICCTILLFIIILLSINVITFVSQMLIPL